MIDPDTPIDQVPFVAVDVETTGLDPASDDIVEIGAVRIQGRKVVDEFSTLVSIERTIPHVAYRVHGIRNDMLVGQPVISEAMALLLAFRAEGPMVEHSHKAFDIAFLERAHGGSLGTVLNTCTLSRRLFPHLRKHSLEECCRRANIVNREPHRALSDARATGELLIYLLQISSFRYPRLGDLVGVAAAG